MEQFSVGSCFRFARVTFERRAWFLIGTTALVVVAYAVVGLPYDILVGQHAPVAAIVAGYIFQLLCEFFIGMGLYHFYLKAHDDVDSVTVKDLWAPKHYISFLATTVLYVIMIIVGLILLIVPGIILMLIFYFPFYPVIERGMGPVEALKYSKRITKGHLMQLFLFMLASIGIAILGIVCLVVGLLVAIPIVTLAGVHAYRTLQKLDGASSVATA